LRGSCLSQRGFTRVKLVYDVHRLDGQLHLHLAPLTNYRPVCRHSWSQGLLLRRTCRVFPSGGQSHSQYSLCLPMEGWLRLSWPDALFCPSKDVTRPGTNWAWSRVTTLIESNSLPLCHASTFLAGIPADRNATLKWPNKQWPHKILCRVPFVSEPLINLAPECIGYTVYILVAWAFCSAIST